MDLAELLTMETSVLRALCLSTRAESSELRDLFLLLSSIINTNDNMDHPEELDPLGMGKNGKVHGHCYNLH